MPLFDVGAGRTPLLALARPEERDFDADARVLVHEHLAMLLGEKVFVATGSHGFPTRSESAGDRSPDDLGGGVVALDTSGAPVVVHVAHSLGGAVLAAALGAAGRASRLTRNDLADLYPTGPDRFHKDVTDFFEALPLAGSTPPGAGQRAPRSGARLVVLCGEVAPDAHDLLTFLHATGAPVQVLRVGVVPSEPGARLVDVSVVGLPSAARPAPRAPETPAPGLSALGRVRSASRRAVERVFTGAVTTVPDEELGAAPVERVPAVHVARVSAPEAPAGPVRTSAFTTTGHATVGGPPDEMTTVLPPVRATDYPVYSEPPVELLEEPLERISAPVAGRAGAGRSPLSAPLPVVDLPLPGTPYTPIFLSVPDVLANLPARPSGVPVLEAELHASLDLAAPPDDLTGYRPGPGEAAAWEGAGTGLTGRSAYRASAFIAAKKYMPEKLEAPTAARAPVRVSAPPAPQPQPQPQPSRASDDADGSPFWADLSAQFDEPVRFDPPEDPYPDDEPHPAAAGHPRDDLHPVDTALAELASELYAPLPLVWVRHRRGERFEAVLHPDGTLRTADGTRFADPSRAANAVSGSTAADGWRVWRAGESGPTLAELRG